MKRPTHLTLSERISIEAMLKAGRSFKEIALELGRDPTTISKEVRRHLTSSIPRGWIGCEHHDICQKSKSVCEPCIHFSSSTNVLCKFCKECYNTCPAFIERICPKLSKPPFVCNGCESRRGCRLRHQLYQAKQADDNYRRNLSESRQGYAIDPRELKRIDAIITPLVKRGQSIHQICVNNADQIMLSERTIYNYIDQGLLSVRNLDLPRKIRFRVRRKERSLKIDKGCYIDRNYEDFLAYTKDNPSLPVVEIDSVEGRKGGKVLLTVFFRNCNFLLAFLRSANTAHSVGETFNFLYHELGHDLFCKMFPIILTDRGSEFTDPISIESNSEGEIRSRVFYCDPYRSDQKGGIEVAHELVRRVLPKGTSFDNLRQEGLSLLMSHINSYTRRKLGDQTSYELFKALYGAETLSKLGIQYVSPNDINLTPRLLKKPNH